MYDHQKWGATYLEEHEIAWLLGNTILECGTLANAALCCEACTATELVGIHGVDLYACTVLIESRCMTRKQDRES